MRPSRGLPRTIRVAILAFFIGLFSGVAPRASQAQAASMLPNSWNNGVAKLGDEVAAAMSPTAVSLSVNNISSLGAFYVDAIGAALREQLQHHSFSFPAANSTAAQSAVALQLTLSESTGEYVWVIQIPGDATDAKPSPTMIVSVSKSDSAGLEPDQQSLSLEKRFVWKEHERLLDFALLKNPASGESTLLVLEVERFAVYKRSGEGWRLSRSTPIPSAATASRDPEGMIDLKEAKVSLKGLECVGDPDLAGVVECKPFGPARVLRGPWIKIPGLPNSVGAGLAEKCRDEYVSLFTGEGDWTQNDSIRAYLAKAVPLPVHAAGNTLEFDGPVLTLHSGPEDNSVRAIVRNLKSGEYEAYVVTATCGN
jgi:hypothetical protein